MIVDGTDWNLEDVKTFGREEFVNDQLNGKVYSEYEKADRVKLFNMVYDYATGGGNSIPLV